MRTPGRVLTSTDLTGLPVRQRGHRHLSGRNLDGTLDASIYHFAGEPLASGYVSVYRGAFACALCDAFPGFTFDGTHLVAKTVCPLPDGLDITFDLVVSSGKVIVNDSLRPVFHVPLRHEVDEPGYNSAAGQAAYCAEMAALGCAYSPVGNSSPSLLRTGADTYVIASMDPDAAPGEAGYLAGEVLANICTNLWAYSIADYQHWIDQGGDPAALPDLATVVEVPNGTYRFAHYTSRADFDHDASWPLVYATITRR